MGLFSARRRGFPIVRIRTPIRLHSEASIGRAARAAVRGIPRVAVAATNDARIVAVVLLLAAIALALEMSASFKS